MKRLLLCGWIFALMAASLAPAPLRAQSVATTNPFEKSIQEIQNQITAWDHQANMQIVLVIAVVIFGAVISVLQKSTGNAAKVATIVLGLATSIVTGINAKVFSVDYRSLQRAAMEGNAIVRKLHGMLAVFSKIQSLASNVGVVHSITGDSHSVLLASGKKVLFYARSDSQWQNPPPSMQSLTGGLISGVAVDSTGSAWIADFDNGILEGPLALQ
jgi:hypothetical protein